MTNTKTAETKKTVAIVGGGAGGLELAVSLAQNLDKSNFEVLLIDQERVHIWKPHLHEVAAGALNASREQVDYLDVAHKFGFTFSRGRVSAMNTAEKVLDLDPVKGEEDVQLFPARSIHYDYCVLALGSTSNDFGTPGAKDNAFSLDDLHGANDFHKHLLDLAERRELSKSSAPINITIVGGGATGVELAAELTETAVKLGTYLKGSDVDPASLTKEALSGGATGTSGAKLSKATPLHISVLNAAGQLLPGLSDRISKGATDILSSRNVKVFNGSKVTRVGELEVVFESDGETKTIHSDLTVWAAGVKAPDIIKGFGLSVARSNQVIINDQLQSSDPAVFAIGDCASIAWKGGKEGAMVPPRAQAAHQMADYLGHHFKDIIENKTVPGFIYKDFGSLVSLGKEDTVGTLMGALSEKSLFVEGKLAKFAYLCLYQGHQMKIHGSVPAVGMLFGKTIQKRFQPKIKLH